MLLLGFIFTIRKVLQMLWKIFSISYLYILENNFLFNKYKKPTYKENKSSFLTSRKMAIFCLQKFVIFNMITDSFLVEKWGNIRVCKEVYLKIKESFGKSFSIPFSVKCCDKNFKYFWFCTLPFLNVLKFEDSKQIKRYIFHYFF